MRPFSGSTTIDVRFWPLMVTYAVPESIQKLL